MDVASDDTSGEATRSAARVSAAAASPEPSYDAFISYSQRGDKPIAQALRSVIQTIGKPWWKARALNVFLDATSLSAAPSLWAAIESRLSRSRYLILLASGESAASKWVDKEVGCFIGSEGKGIDRLLIGLTDGELVWDETARDFKWNAAPPLCPSLRGRFETEPLWVDLRAYRNAPAAAKRSNPDFLNAALDLAATIRGVEKSDLYSDELKRRKRNLRAAYGLAAVLAVLTVSAGTAAWYAVRNEQLARTERDTALTVQSRFLADAARQANEKGDHGTAAALALEALPDARRGITRPRVLQAEIVLYQSLLKLRERLVLRHPAPAGMDTHKLLALFSPDGKHLLTADDHLTARIWDATTGAAIAILHDARIRDVMGYFAAAFSPDGKLVVTAARNGLILWDAATWRQTKLISAARPLSPLTITFSPNGRRIATQSDNTARVFDAATGAELLVLQHANNVISVAFSPDGTRLATASGDSTTKIWDATTGATLATLQDPNKRGMSAVAFSPDGKRVVVASGSKFAWIWELATNTTQVLDHGDWPGLPNTPLSISSAAFSPDGTRVITGTPYAAFIWDLSTLKPAIMLNHLGFVTEAAFSPDGKRVVTAGWGGIARVWNLAAALDPTVLVQAPAGAKGDTPAHRVAASSPDGTRVLMLASENKGTDNVAQLWDTTTGNQIGVLRGGNDEITVTAFSQDGKRLLVASKNSGAVTVWDATTARKISSFKNPGIKAASFSMDGSKVVTASSDGLARVWDLSTGAEISTLRGHQGEVRQTQFSWDGKRIVTASDDWTARIWDAKHGTELRVLDGHSSEVYAAAFSPDGKLVLTSAGQTMRMWDAEIGKEIARRDKIFASAFTFSHDGKRLVTAGSQVVAWDMTTRTASTVIGLDSTAPQLDSWPSAVFTADETRVLAAASHGASLWDLATGAKIVDFCCHTDKTYSAVFSPDGARVITVAADRTALVWRAFQTTQDLVDYARSVIPRELSPEQRKQFFLQD